MQGLGFLFNLLSGFDKERVKEILHNHKGYFNTHPYFSGYIIGAIIRAYELNESPEKIKKFITISQTTLASIGDTLFWQTIRPALLLVSVILGMKFGLVGPIVFLIVYNILHLYHRAGGFILGYKKGADIIYYLKQKEQKLFRTFYTIGAISTGLLSVILIKDIGSVILIPFTIIFFILLSKGAPRIIILTIFIFLFIIIAIIPL